MPVWPELGLDFLQPNSRSWVLVVEAEATIALMQASLLAAAGCTVVGSVRRVRTP